MRRLDSEEHADGPIAGLGAIVMAAGLGKRMRSKLAKVLHPIAGRPMVCYAVDLAERLADSGVAVVVGYQGAEVRSVVRAHAGSDVRIVEQGEQLGTGHAVMQARADLLRAYGHPADNYVILNGDTPLLAEATVRRLVAFHLRERSAVTVLTAVLDDPAGYGRVIRDAASGAPGSGGPVLRIVEDRDASPDERAVREINVGTYVVNGPFLFEALDKLEPKNAQREYYLTDIVSLAVERGLNVRAAAVPVPDEGLGINTRAQLAAAEQVVRRSLCAKWMDAGVTLRDPATTMIGWDVTIGQDTVIHPYVTLEGKTTIGQDCVIRSHVRMTDAMVGDRVVVQESCVVQDSRLGDETVVGPFAHLRPGSRLHRAAKVGNFVEMKKAELGEEAKANHLSYLGDARIGKKTNIGAGTITCNYDGVHKHETVIEDEVFIGSDSQLVAPVVVGRGAIVAAGTTVTEDVPANALALSRTPQVNRPGWASRRRALPAAGAVRGKPAGRAPSPKVPQPAAKAKGVALRKTSGTKNTGRR